MRRSSQDPRQAVTATRRTSVGLCDRYRLGLFVRMIGVLTVFGVLYLLLLWGLRAGIAWLLAARMPTHPMTSIPGLPMLLAIGLSLLAVGALYWVGVRRVLGTFDAVELSRTEAPRTHQMTEALCAELDIDVPTLMVAPMAVPGAMAVGRCGNGTVILSEELREILTGDEIKAILAHELAHLKHRDTIVMTFAGTIRLAVTVLVTVVVTVMLAIVAIMVRLAVSMLTLGRIELQIDEAIDRTASGTRIATMTILGVFLLALSRYREFVADATAAEVVSDHRSLVRALRKMEQHSDEPDQPVSPFILDSAGEGRLGNLFITHPTTDKRVKVLKDHHGE